MTTKRNLDIAIIGMAFRLPGDVTTVERLWDVLQKGENLITEVDERRFCIKHYAHPRKSEAGKSYTFNAGVLSKIDEFDAELFGISPREAQQMDPQQRLLLETTWGALENARQDPKQLSGSDCAVYIGISGNEYGHNTVNDIANIDSYTMLGSCPSIAANRISYVFDLHGPSMAIDTACSSALVALHQACHSLSNNEASTAIVGGVNLLLSPAAFVGFSKASMLSPEGQCKSFSASAQGYVRSEGCVVFVLKPLDAAVRDDDFIHATIVHTGTNNDGHTNGIALPSATSQAALLKRVHASAEIVPDDIDYLETHGTGTMVGDHAETLALGAALGKQRAHNNPLLIGSIKSNLGHLEPASGLVGVLKTILCLKHAEIPPSIQSKELNPNIDFDALNLSVVQQSVTLPKKDKPAIMAVNSFGFGGTNAHVILSEYTNKPVIAEPTRQDVSTCLPPLVLSFHNEQALIEQTKQYSALLQHAPDTYYDLAYALAHRRPPHAHNSLVYGENMPSILATLNQLAQGLPAPHAVRAPLLGENLPVVLVYSGNGSQWQGMGAQLLSKPGIFSETIDEIDALFSRISDFSIKSELLASIDTSRYDETEVAQPTLFALQVAMTRYLLQNGLQIKATTGHSVGEIAAAWACGALTLEQAVDVVYHRSFWQGKTRGHGKMMAVAVSEDIAETIIKNHDLAEKVSIAAINSADSVTLAGDLQALQQIQLICEQQTLFHQLLDLDYAFHTHQMDHIRQDLLNSLSHIKPTQNSIPFISTVLGKEAPGEALTSTYWWENIRQPVKFHQAITTLADNDSHVFIEVGPHPVLKFYLNDILRRRKIRSLVIPTLKRNAVNESHELEQALYQAWVCGAAVDKTAWFPVKGCSIDLPIYPLIRDSYWLTPTNESAQIAHLPMEHPLLGRRIKANEPVWENHLDPILVPYLADHMVDGVVIMPAAGFAEMALSASINGYENEQHDVRDLDILAPMVFDEKTSRIVRSELHPQDGGFIIKSRTRQTNDPWIIHMVGRLITKPILQKTLHQSISIHEFQAQAHETYEGSLLYQRAQAIGLTYGQAFQGIQQVWLQNQAALAYVDFSVTDLTKHCLYPGILDACFQLLISLLYAEQTMKKYVLLPVRLGRLTLFGRVPNTSFITAKLVKQSKQSCLVDFTILDEHGDLIAMISACRFQHAHLGDQSHAIKAYICQPRLLQPLQPLNTFKFADLQRIQQQIERTYTDPTACSKRHFEEVIPVIDMMISQFTYQAIVKLAAGLNTFTHHELCATAMIPSHQHAFLQWCLTTLCEDGLLQKCAENGYQIIQSANIDDAHSLWNMLLNQHPHYQTDLLLAGRVGLHLQSLLKGEMKATDLLSSQHKRDALHHFYEATPAQQGINHVIRETVRAIIAQRPDTQRIRILDVGYGIGSLSTQLIHLLPADKTDYQLIVVDDSKQFTLETHLFVNVRAMASPSAFLEEDTLSEQTFDLILIRNYAHEWHTPEHCLARLREHLSPDGVLLLIEQHSDRLHEFILGSQRDIQLCASQQWMQRLTRSGYMVTEPVFEPGAQQQEGFYFVLAQAADTIDPMMTPHKTGGDILLLNEMGAIGQPLYATWLDQLDPVNSVLIQAATPDNTAPEQEQIAYFNRQLHPLAARKQPLRIIWLFANMSSLEQGTKACTTLIYLVKAIHALTWTIAPQLVLITHEGLPLLSNSNDHINLNTTIWGVARVLMNEHEAIACKLIDLQGPLDSSLFSQLHHEIMMDDKEHEVILTKTARFGLRAERIDYRNNKPQDVIQGNYSPRRPEYCEGSPTSKSMFSSGDPSSQAPRDDGRAVTIQEGDYALDFKRGGVLSNLQWTPVNKPLLAENDVLVRPYACGLNFRDVMYAMGLLPDEAVENGFLGASLGMEFSGEIIATGTEVSQFQKGDQVMGFAPSSFSSMTVTNANVITSKPRDWSHAAAATVPIAFFTAFYAMHYLARLQKGESILIHGAAGGVGLAAIQVANYLGAKIYTTAGSNEKRDCLKLMGITHCYDSRSLLFADQLLADTNGEGIDVVLNCLSGDAIGHSLSILKPFGRFLELGKRDFFANSKMGLRPFRNNISYFGIDADQLLIKKPELCAPLFKDIMMLFEQSHFVPLPHREFDTHSIHESFRYMQQSRHIGKIVVNLHEKPKNACRMPLDASSLTLSADASYLVTGGCNGFGLQTAIWLAKKGARHLILVGRGGVTTPEAKDALHALLEQGVTVHVHCLDISDAASVDALIQTINRSSMPLKGIIHAAAIYDDALILNLTTEKMHHVLAPKIQGALNLHQSTLNMSLDFFVTYSSVSTLFGNPGQANYVAANACLERLMAYRKSLGLSGLFVAWGPIADVGYLARNNKLKQIVSAKMGELLTADDALIHLEKLMLTNVTGVYVANLNLSKMQAYIPSMHSPKFSELLAHETRFAGLNSDQPDEIRAFIAHHSHTEALLHVSQILTKEVAHILRLSTDKIDANVSLLDLGMDSLVGAELSHAITERFSLHIPMLSLAQGISIETIAERIVKQLQTEDDVESTQLTAFIEEASRHGEHLTTETAMDIVSTTA